MSIETKFRVGGVSEQTPSGAKRHPEINVREPLKPYIDCIIQIASQPGSNLLLGLIHIASKAAGYGRGTDTVTLIPPHGFTGNSVKVTLTDDYAFVITGVSGQRKAETSICWQIPGLLRGACLSQITNGKSVQTFKKQLTIPKSKFTFQLTVAIGAVAVGTSAGAADSGVSFALPTQWTCTYASGFPCR
jgi:hypothetical protein